MQTVTVFLSLLSLTLPAAFAYPQFQGGSEADFASWEKPGPNDVRSPCPGLNALANHHILPHSGKGITHDNLRQALLKVNIAPDVTDFIFGGVAKFGLVSAAGTIDLDVLSTPKKIEHDGSLSRADASSGDGHSFNETIFNEWKGNFKGAEVVTLDMAAEARVNRIHTQKQRNPEFALNAQQDFISKAETLLAVGTMGGFDKLQAPQSYLDVFFGQERFPVKEGWRPSAATLTIAGTKEVASKMKSSV